MKKKILALVIGATILIQTFSALAAQYGEQLIVNGSFEQQGTVETKAANWSTNGSWKRVENAEDGFTDGKASLYHAPQGSEYASAIQNVKIEAEKDYLLTFDYKINAGACVLKTTVDKKTETWLMPTDGKFVAGAVSIHSGSATNLKIDFMDSYNTLDMYIDNVKLIFKGPVKNMVINGDFEDGHVGSTDMRPNSWITDSTGWFKVNEEEAHGGSASLLIPSRPLNEYLSQYVEVDAQSSYYLKWYAKGEKKHYTMAVYGMDGADKRLIASAVSPDGGSDDWEENVLGFNSGDYDKIKIEIINNVNQGSGVYIDDISLNKRVLRTEKINVDGYIAEGNTATAKAEIYDDLDAVTEIEYQWQIADDIYGIWTNIDDTNSNLYSIKSSDAGKYVRVMAVPKSGEIYGEQGYSKAFYVSGLSKYVPINISQYFNGLFVAEADNAGSEKTATIGGGVIDSAAIYEQNNESNAFEVDKIPYSIYCFADKCAIRTGYDKNGNATDDDVEISVGGRYLSGINLVMAYDDMPEGEQKAIVKYENGYKEEFAYTAELFEQKGEGKTINTEPFKVHKTTEPDGKGYLYEYSFKLEKPGKIESIVFPHEAIGDNLVIFSLTGIMADEEDLKLAIEGMINDLGKDITLNDKDKIREIVETAKIYTSMGGKIEDINGYEELVSCLAEIESCEMVSGDCDFTINLKFKNPMLKESINEKTVYLENVDKSRYRIEYIEDGNGIKGVQLKVINYFDYKTITLKVSKNIICAAKPHFTADNDETFVFTPKKKNEVKTAEAKVENDKLSLKAEIINNSDTSKKYAVIAAAYDKAGSMITYIKTEKEIQGNDTLKTEKSISCANADVENIKVFVLSGMEEMKLIYQDSATLEKSAGNKNLPMYDVMTGRVNISGYTESLRENIPVVLMVKNPPDENGVQSLKYINTLLTTTGGFYNFSFELENTKQDNCGEYTVLTGGYDYDAVKKDSLYITSKKEIQSIIDDVNNLPAEDLKLEEYKKLLYLDFELFDEADKANLSKLIKNEISNQRLDNNDVQGLMELFKRASIIEGYNSKNQKVTNDKNEFVFADFLQLSQIDNDGITIYSLYDKLLAEEGRKNVQNALMGKNFQTLNELKKAFSELLVLNAVAYPNVAGVEYVGEILTDKNIDAVGIKADEYKTLKDKSQVYVKLAKKSYESIEDLAEAIKKASEKNDNTKPSGSYGSGGKSSGVPVVRESDDENKTTELVMFDDVGDNHWAYKYVYKLKDFEVVNGKSKMMFKPDDYVKREELVKMLCVAFDIAVNSENIKIFDDVKKGAWYENYVQIASSRGIINGIGNNLFGVGQYVTREDLCTMSARIGEFNAASENNIGFKDKDMISDYAVDAVGYLSENGVVNGFEDETFRPKELCTRAQACKIIYKLLEMWKWNQQ